ncbi:MAG: dihydroorotate dehydrogenase [Planctomycetota bacterium]
MPLPSFTPPVLLAAGTAGTLDEMAGVIDLSKLGGIVTKSITKDPRDGNAAWRVAPVKGGMINAIGLANPGIDAFMADWAPKVASVPTTVIGSAAGFTVEQYTAVCRSFETIDAMPAVELNVSCPNTEHGIDFGTDPKLLAELVAACREAMPTTGLIVKLPPIAIGTPHTIVDLARAAIDAGAEALTLCNTTPAMAIDIDTGEPKLGNRHGGLSGPAVHPIVTRLIDLCYREFCKERGIPILGLGGVLDWDDAAEFMLAGASAVQVGTASFVDPKRAIRIAKRLTKWYSERTT